MCHVMDHVAGLGETFMLRILKGLVKRLAALKPSYRVQGGLLATIGYILSPLSWWNDVFVNIPIAYLIASLVSIAFPQWFPEAFAASYLATNVLGFLLMHIGVEKARGKSLISARAVVKYVVVSVIYTGLVLVLAGSGLVKPLEELAS